MTNSRGAAGTSCPNSHQRAAIAAVVTEAQGRMSRQLPRNHTVSGGAEDETLLGRYATNVIHKRPPPLAFDVHVLALLPPRQLTIAASNHELTEVRVEAH